MQRFAVAAIAGFLFFGTAAVADPTPAFATGGEGETWPAFTESSGCGARRISTPNNSYSGWLDKETILRGEFAAMFGRTVQAVLDDVVEWEIPGSGETLVAHPRLLPALDQVQATLDARLDAGDLYRITPKYTYSTAARTIAGGLRVSRHTFGAAFDINAHRNPYSRANELKTDMPDWWLQAFLDAGFCWGGLWIGSKDTMHLSWQGPAFSGESMLQPPYEPLTQAQSFSKRAAWVPVARQGTSGLIGTVLADADGNGATDIIRVRRAESDLVVDVSVASYRHNVCSLRSSWVSGIGEKASSAHALGFGDWDGRGGQDLWLVSDVGGELELTVRWAFGGYSAETSALTSVPTPDSDAWITSGDFDVDGSLDLFIVDNNMLTVWAVDPDSGASSVIFEGRLPFSSPEHLTLGDSDLDHVPDVWAIQDGEVLIALGADGYDTIAQRHRPESLPSRIMDVVGADYDGDGRDDLIVFDGVTKQVWLGNTRLADGLPLEVWFENPERECEDSMPVWDPQELRFSTSGWVAEGSYKWRRTNGLVTGCDPNEVGCGPRLTTHGSFAEFLAWILGLEAVQGDGTLAAPRALAEAGYDAGCDVYDTDCWEVPMLQSEVASRFGQFMAQRRGDVPPPHRWITPVAEHLNLNAEPR